MKAIDRMFEIVFAAAPPPGTFQTTTASTRMIATLRRFLLRSRPTRTPRLVGGDEFLGGLGLRHRRRRADRLLDRLRGEPVADPEVRVDVAPCRRYALELGAQLAHEHVDRAVAVDHRVAPHALVDLLARDHLAAEVAQQPDQLELAA